MICDSGVDWIAGCFPLPAVHQRKMLQNVFGTEVCLLLLRAGYRSPTTSVTDGAPGGQRVAGLTARAGPMMSLMFCTAVATPLPPQLWQGRQAGW